MGLANAVIHRFIPLSPVSGSVCWAPVSVTPSDLQLQCRAVRGRAFRRGPSWPHSVLGTPNWHFVVFTTPSVIPAGLSSCRQADSAPGAPPSAPRRSLLAPSKAVRLNVWPRPLPAPLSSFHRNQEGTAPPRQCVSRPKEHGQLRAASSLTTPLQPGGCSQAFLTSGVVQYKAHSFHESRLARSHQHLPHCGLLTAHLRRLRIHLRCFSTGSQPSARHQWLLPTPGRAGMNRIYYFTSNGSVLGVKYRDVLMWRHYRQ
ncbi:hypothetical protein NDU88_004444 [Pleurodeles waltl]|uniref:Uncharacterized protein n=1 Tax=Pleurodeles waltl TaxID=8319 RepID=A0AAV7RFR2_PLEWA|nr:hypothetical protein NDU88_004444 [Pleurodeles waltl]